MVSMKTPETLKNFKVKRLIDLLCEKDEELKASLLRLSEIETILYKKVKKTPKIPSSKKITKTLLEKNLTDKNEYFEKEIKPLRLEFQKIISSKKVSDILSRIDYLQSLENEVIELYGELLSFSAKEQTTFRLMLLSNTEIIDLNKLNLFTILPKGKSINDTFEDKIIYRKYLENQKRTQKKDKNKKENSLTSICRNHYKDKILSRFSITLPEREIKSLVKKANKKADAARKRIKRKIDQGFFKDMDV